MLGFQQMGIETVLFIDKTELKNADVTDIVVGGVGRVKSVRFLCTVQAGRKLLPGMKHNLNILCDYYGIPLDHHKADSDSRACAEILLRYIADGANEKDFIRTYRLT